MVKENTSLDGNLLRAIVLAAGKGKRLQSEAVSLPKVLRMAAGRPLLSWVLDNLSFIPHGNITLVVGYEEQKVRKTMGDDYDYVLQKKQLGTGHAVAAAADSFLGYKGNVLVAYGDMPLYQMSTYQDLVEAHCRSGAACTLLTARTREMDDYGRIIRDSEGRISGIVERKDCTPEQAAVDEVNPGVYVFKSEVLFEALKKLRSNNAQGEYYLTDVPKIILGNKFSVETLTIDDDRQIRGVNTPEDLEICEKILLTQMAR